MCDKAFTNQLAIRYPLAYTFCVLPLSIIRWAGFANPELLGRPQILPVSMVFSSIFNLMGLINVLLIFWTRPAILLIGTSGRLNHLDQELPLHDGVGPGALEPEVQGGGQQGGRPSRHMRSLTGFGGPRVGGPDDVTEHER
jgi:hypothetical protein